MYTLPSTTVLPRNFSGLDIFYIAYFSTILVVGFVFHGLIIAVFALNANIRKNTSNIIFLSIAMADSCTICWTLPVCLASRLKGAWPWDSSSTCEFSGVLDNAVAACSMWNVALYAVDRFIYVMFPLNYDQKMGRKKAVALTLCVWVYSILLSLPPIFGYNSYEFTKNSYSCGIKDVKHSYFLIYFIGAFPVPLITICISYLMIYLIARGNNNRVNKLCMGDGKERKKSTQAHKSQVSLSLKSTAGVTAVVICEVVCLLPVFVIGLYHYISKLSWEEHLKRQKMYDAINQLGTILFFLNCNAVLIIFCACNRQLRKAVHRILRCQSRRDSEINRIHRQVTSNTEFCQLVKINSQKSMKIPINS